MHSVLSCIRLWTIKIRNVILKCYTNNKWEKYVHTRNTDNLQNVLEITRKLHTSKNPILRVSVIIMSQFGGLCFTFQNTNFNFYNSESKLCLY